jgi:hypothetical protein
MRLAALPVGGLECAAVLGDDHPDTREARSNLNYAKQQRDSEETEESKKVGIREGHYY